MKIPRTPYIVALAASLLGCPTFDAVPTPSTSLVAPLRHDELARLLDRHVRTDGTVDFEGWSASEADVAALQAYVRRLLHHAPHSSPEQFAGESDQLAYWINLYNALALQEIILRWPIESVDDLPANGPFSGAGRGILHDLELDVGGRRMNLLAIEAEIIRSAFDDPRAHFAISCGAASCPLLPRTPLDGLTIDARLDAAARLFINQRKNVRVDDKGATVVVSPLFGWHEAAFIDHVRARTTHPAPTLLDLFELYAEPPLLRELARARKHRYSITFREYDWRIGPVDLAAVETDIERGTTPNVALPGLELTLRDGTRWNVAEARGKVLLIDFWATWCRPCLWSFPRYVEMQLAHEKRGLLVVAVAQDDRREPVDDFLQAHPVAIDVALDPDGLTAEPPLSIATLPTVILVDRTGVIRYRHEGYSVASFGTIASKLEQLLAEAP